MKLIASFCLLLILNITSTYRMPASADLLDMFLEHMEEVVSPPIQADEIDPTFNKVKHQITIHILRKRQ
jgi:hypothetical protein